MFVDFVASDVPGVRVPVFLGGAPVRAQYAFGPTIGSAVNVALLTYVDTCALGIDVDTTAIPRRPIRASRPIPKRSQAHIDLGDGLAQRGGSTNHGTVRL
jgi:WS/DGAT C-terminal domain